MQGMRSPKIVPASESSLGAEASGRVAGLVFLAALRDRASSSNESPRDRIVAWVASHRHELAEFRSLVQGGGGFSDAVMADRFDSGFPFDEHGDPGPDIGVWLALYTSLWVGAEIDLHNGAVVQEAVSVGIDLQLVGLIDALARAVVGLGSEVGPSAERLEQILTAGAAFDPRGQVTATVKTVFRCWRVSHLSRYQRPDFPLSDSERRHMTQLDHELAARIRPYE